MVFASLAKRCPACGQRLDSFAERCPLCDFRLGDELVTGADITPYAEAYADGRRGWRVMVAWVWLAGSGRLKHLALMRSSAASRRFARINVLLLALGIGLFEWGVVGWKWVPQGLDTNGTVESTGPSGAGWFRVASMPSLLSVERAAETPTDLWWNPAQCLIAVPLAGVLALFAMWLVGVLTKTGVAWFHRSPYRKQQRMTAAIQYSTAWVIPFLAASVVAAFRPIAYVGAVARWRWHPSDNLFLIMAAIFAGFGATLWWFWLVRLGATAPPATRARVVTFIAVGVPVVVVAGTAAWWYGCRQGYGPIFDFLGLRFS